MAKRREDAAGDPGSVEGRVITVSGPRWTVLAGDEEWSCSLRKGRFREEGPFTNPVAVGDRVRITPGSAGEALIEEVLPRRGWLSRVQARGREQIIVANAEQVVIVVSLREPEFRPRVADRFLVAVERAGFEAVIALTKADLAGGREEFEDAVAGWRSAGYPVIFTSAVTGEGVVELRRRVEGRITILAGHSGVGKSTLLNAIEPGLGLRTAEISRKWGKGVHTTTAAWWLPLAAGGAVVDTPGVRSFAIAGLAPEDVAIFFRDLAPFVDACRFRGCTHDHEPGCAVRGAVAEGKVPARRYDSYLRIIRGIEEEDA